MLNSFDEAFALFFEKAQAKAQADYIRAGFESLASPKLSAEWGKRYIRLVVDRCGQRMAFGFVDTTNGTVLKADGWKRPAKGPRGNVYDADNGTRRVRWTGIA